jgi:carboxypeptidase C (cathepsin A)
VSKVCLDAKENIQKALEKLNREPVTNESAELYYWLTKSLSNLETIEAMQIYGDYGYSNGMVRMPDVSFEGSMDMRRGRDGDSDGMYRESGRTRTMPRYYYSGHMGKEHMMQDLNAMLADADSEKERRRIKDLIEDLRELK